MKNSKFLIPLILISSITLGLSSCYADDGSNPFLYTFHLNETNKTATIASYNGKASNLTIPTTLGGYTITGIGYYAFQYNEILETIALPETVESIEDYAFSYCTNLTSITILNSLKNISYGAFQSCESLESLTIPETITTIMDFAFAECSSLKSLVLPKNLSNLGARTFYNCTNDLFFEHTNIDFADQEWNEEFKGTYYLYSEETPTTSGNYWHYVDDVPTKYPAITE